MEARVCGWHRKRSDGGPRSAALLGAKVRIKSALLFGALLGGCSGGGEAPVEDGELGFLRGAVLAPAGAGGRPVGGGRELVETAWTPGEDVTVGGVTDQAPARAECLPLFSQDLGDVSTLIAMGGEAPNAALAWSPDGALLAVGSHRGEILVLDGWTGEVRGRRKLAETMVKSVTWSPDGAVVYAAEQSPDAFVHALDVPSLTSRWSFRLADELESSPPPPATDIYGVYTLPAAWSLLTLRGGDVLVAGTHSWPKDGTRTNLARLWRLAPDGSVRRAWPAEGPLDGTLLFPNVDEDADRLAISVGRSAEGPAPEGVAIGGVQVLRLSTFEVLDGFIAEPLAPHFTRAKPWEAVDVEGDVVFAGYSDGRARLYRLGGGGTPSEADSAPPPAPSEPTTLNLGTPWLAGDVPLAASVSWGFLDDERLVAVTGETNIPWGSQTTATRPPSPHPQANRLHVFGHDGALRWAWSGGYTVAGVSPSPSGKHVVVGAGERRADDRRDLFGALLFRLEGEGGGEDRLEAVCATEGPVFFRQALHDDGRVAVAEVPWKADDGSVLGTYRVTVLR